MSDLPTPVTREERYLNGIAQGDLNDLPSPVTREEEYLDYIARHGGGGGGGTTNYNALENKPQIAGTTLQGNKSLADLGIASASDVTTALGDKVDKVAGKGLSTNDYDNTEKGKVADNTAAIEAIVNEYGAKNLFDINNPVFISGFSVSGNVLTNSETDTKNIFTFDLRDNINTLYVNKDISQNGHYEYTFTVSSAITYLIFKHNGASRDLRIDVKPVTQGDWIISFDVDGYNPSVVGGLEISKIMIRDARIKDPTYVPYAMTNEQLTDAVTDIIPTVNGLRGAFYQKENNSNYEVSVEPYSAYMLVFTQYLDPTTINPSIYIVFTDYTDAGFYPLVEPYQEFKITGVSRNGGILSIAWAGGTTSRLWLCTLRQ